MIGTEMKKLFAGAGWFTVKFNKIYSSREDLHQVCFQEDGDIEIMSVRTILDIQQEKIVAFGDARFKFCHNSFCTIYAGKVVKIKLNGKRKCRSSKKCTRKCTS